jgi:hypothetical protein
MTSTESEFNMLKVVELLDAPLALTRSYTPGRINVELFNKLSVEDIDNLSVEDKYVYHYFLHDSPLVDKKKIDKCKVELNEYNKLSIMDRLMAYSHGDKKIPFEEFGERVWVCHNHVYAPYYYHTDDPMTQLGLCRWNGDSKSIRLVPVGYTKRIPAFAFKRIPIRFYDDMTEEQVESLDPTLRNMLNFMKELEKEDKCNRSNPDDIWKNI